MLHVETSLQATLRATYLKSEYIFTKTLCLLADRLTLQRYFLFKETYLFSTFKPSRKTFHTFKTIQKNISKPSRKTLTSLQFPSKKLTSNLTLFILGALQRNQKKRKKEAKKSKQTVVGQKT